MELRAGASHAGLLGPAQFEMPKTKPHRISVGQPVLGGNERTYLNDCLDQNFLTQGPYVHKFEERFAKLVYTKHALACSNGTTALHLALLSLGLGPGDEVLIPSLTYVATANAVAYCGATPVLCDVEDGTWTISGEEIMRKRTKRTKGIIPVHLYGHPADMDYINSLAMHYGWWVVEDAAEAIGAAYKGRPVGALGTMATFSFYGNKTLTTGEGGMVTTNDQRLHARMYMLRGQGMSTTQRYFHPMLGYNYRMTNLQGALGCAQLERLSSFLDRRKELWHTYSNWFRQNEIEFQTTSPNVTHGHWMFTILTPPGVDRDAVMQFLDEEGIETRPAFIPMHRLPMYADTHLYPISNSVSARGINLPTHAALSEDDLIRVCTATVEAIRRHNG